MAEIEQCPRCHEPVAPSKDTPGNVYCPNQACDQIINWPATWLASQPVPIEARYRMMPDGSVSPTPEPTSQPVYDSALERASEPKPVLNLMAELKKALVPDPLDHEHGYPGDARELRQLLSGRDRFLVERDLFSEFAQWISANDHPVPNPTEVKK